MTQQQFGVGTNGGDQLYSGSHGLGGYPIVVRLHLKCVSDELVTTGYSNGDMIPGEMCICDTSDYDVTAFNWVATTTTILVRRNAQVTSGAISVPRKSDGQWTPITSGNEAKFQLVLNAWA
jgi:hypothetical protein